ncbi:hypothetical protein ACQFN5_28780 (plasmid) [Klebsiella sp. WOUb02]|uniref:hypothetical protein n=1 Tax=Klebsiella sp. WOUb02 TaxID=3161071 RepID=UPI003CEA7193
MGLASLLKGVHSAPINRIVTVFEFLRYGQNLNPVFSLAKKAGFRFFFALKTLSGIHGMDSLERLLNMKDRQ